MKSLKIAIVSDAYFPHISGVATTIKATAEELTKMGHNVKVISPIDFKYKMSAPSYPEVKLALMPYGRLKKMLDEFKPDALHISVEGPLGMAARSYAKKHGIHFTTAYHTRFPEYLRIQMGVPESLTYHVVRWFHNSANGVMVAAESLRKELDEHGIKNLLIWPRGVDAELFHPDAKIDLPGKRPIFMYMGRVAHEKNIEAFLSLDLDGTKYVVGDGPARKSLEKKYPDAIFTGYKFGKELAGHLAAADVFVFPSLTDTLGLVMLEANACGTPIATFPSQASDAVVKRGENGIVSTDLKEACMEALKLSRARCREIALDMGWQKPAQMFLDNLVVSKAE